VTRAPAGRQHGAGDQNQNLLAGARRKQVDQTGHPTLDTGWQGGGGGHDPGLLPSSSQETTQRPANRHDDEDRSDPRAHPGVRLRPRWRRRPARQPGYSLSSAATGAPIARLRPTGQSDAVEVLW
jgi:hypothetical protein